MKNAEEIMDSLENGQLFKTELGLEMYAGKTDDGYLRFMYVYYFQDGVEAIDATKIGFYLTHPGITTVHKKDPQSFKIDLQTGYTTPAGTLIENDFAMYQKKYIEILEKRRQATIDEADDYMYCLRNAFAEQSKKAVTDAK